MSNISKNLLLGLTLVCVIVLIVFCIQLIVINRGVEPIEPGSTISGDAEQGDGDSEIDDEETSGEDDGSAAAAVVTPRPPPQGIRRSFRVSDSNLLIVYAREELFDFEERDFDWWFLYTGGGLATLEISHTMIGPQGVAEHAESFLNSYSGSNAAEFTGEESIGGSELKGYHVSAQHGNEIYEAWIHTLIDSDLALVFVICYENDQQKDALYEVLSTLDMEVAPLTASAAGVDAGGAGTDSNEPEEPTEPEEPEDDGSQGDRPVVS